jgi:hypothetical protein
MAKENFSLKPWSVTKLTLDTEYSTVLVLLPPGDARLCGAFQAANLSVPERVVPDAN